MNTNFEAIIFDLGGVLLNIDYHKTIQAFKKLGIKNFDEVYTQAQQSELFNRLETGMISEDTFFQDINNIANTSFSNEDISQAWNAMLLDLPKHRVKLLKKMAKSIPIFLLSNTNSIHLKAFQSEIEMAYGRKDLLEELFVETFYSHLIHARKPDSEAFHIIIDKYDLNPGKTLFIDDSEQHIIGAKKIGLHTHHLVHQDISTLFGQG